MDREKYSKLIETFFEWDQAAILSVVDELLSAAAAEDAQSPARIMSQNYETAQANPEIHLLPGNLKDAMRVLQLNVPFAGMYSVANQKVQSSTGSIDIDE